LAFLFLVFGGAAYVIFQKPELLKEMGVETNLASNEKSTGELNDSDHRTHPESVGLDQNHSKVNIIDLEHYQLLKDQCLSCHGEVVNGKAKIKGDFDIMPLLQSANPAKHTREWIKVLEQIESGEMPPEEEEPLSVQEIAMVLGPVKMELNDGKLPVRLLTSQEILNSSAAVFNFNKESFDPFQALHFLSDPNARFPTHNSINLMSENYLYEIAQGVKGI